MISRLRAWLSLECAIANDQCRHFAPVMQREYALAGVRL